MPAETKLSQAGAMRAFTIEDQSWLTAVARGEKPAERFIRGGSVVNVYSGELMPAHVAIARGRIAYVGASEAAIGPETEIIDARGFHIAPGWIEPHSHPWLLYNPVTMIEGVLPGGTTLVFNDNLFFYLQAGPTGFLRMLDALTDLPIRYRWLIRLVSQSEWEGEAAAFAPEKILPLLEREAAAGTAEVTRWPLLFRGEPGILGKITRARQLGRRSDGHTAGASYEKLNAIAAGGISACHEAITREQVLDRLRLGLWTMLRHSSVRPDMPELARAITESRADSRRLMLTVDGPAPRFIAEGGYIDEALRQAVQHGIPPITAIQMATINPATYFRMDDQVGGIAPGRLADLVLLPDLESFRPARVMVGGQDVALDGRLVARLPEIDWDGLGMRPAFHLPETVFQERFYGPRQPGEQLPVIEFIANVITRGAGFQAWLEGAAAPEGLILAVLIDRAGRWVTRAWLRGFAPGLRGMASTYNTTTQLLVMGRDASAMAHSARAVAGLSGGIAFANGSGATWKLALPIAGMMSPLPFADTIKAQREIEARVQAAGFGFGDILYALLFLACDFLPGWRLTARGVLDVKKSQIVRVAESLD